MQEEAAHKIAMSPLLREYKNRYGTWVAHRRSSTRQPPSTHHSPPNHPGGRSYAAQQQELIERQHAARVAELEAIIAGLRKRMAEQTKAMNEVRTNRARSTRAAMHRYEHASTHQPPTMHPNHPLRTNRLLALVHGPLQAEGDRHGGAEAAVGEGKSLPD